MFSYPPRALTYLAALAVETAATAVDPPAEASVSSSRLLPLPGVLMLSFLIMKFALKKYVTAATAPISHIHAGLAITP